MLGILFAALFLGGVPIAYTLGVTSLAYLKAVDLPLVLVPQRMFLGLESFLLLAVPMFILAGSIMNASGITRRLLKLGSVFFRKVRGGLAYANTATCVFFAGITGVGAAETSALGSVFVPAMKDEGYDVDYAAALTAMGSIIGPIIPPSVAMVIYGSMAEVSIAKLFLGGVIPGVLLGLSFMLVSWYYAKVKYHPTTQFKLDPVTIKDVVDSILALFMPVLIVGGILGGIFTPTEAAGVSVLYAFLVGFFVYRELKLSDIPKILEETAVTVGAVLTIVATAALFGWILGREQVPEMVATAITSITRNPVLILLMVNLFLLVVGMFMETLASIVVLTPVLLPLMKSVGIDPIHFGIIMVVNLSIGLVTPPVGVNTFVACAIAKISIERLFRAAVPYLAAGVAVLLLLSYWPQVVMFLPSLYGS